MSKVNLLLIDDDEMIITTLGRELRHAGYRVHGASNARDGFRLAETHPLDLAIVDIKLPEISGTDLARELIQKFNVPSLYLSAYTESVLVDQAVTTGGIGYLVKPVDINQLLPAVETALARAKDLKALEQLRVQLQHAVENGRNTNVAIGIMMERLRIPRKEAFELLRKEARSHRIKLEELARKIVNSGDSLNRLGRQGESATIQINTQ